MRELAILTRFLSFSSSIQILKQIYITFVVTNKFIIGPLNINYSENNHKTNNLSCDKHSWIIFNDLSLVRRACILKGRKK